MKVEMEPLFGELWRFGMLLGKNDTTYILIYVIK